MFYATGQYKLDDLEHMSKDQSLNIPQRVRSDIRLALSETIPFVKGEEKTRLMNLKSKLIDYSMGGK